jgi:hypothetical protein
MTDAENAMLLDLVNALAGVEKRHPTVRFDMYCVMLMSELVRGAKHHPNKEVLLSKLDALWVNLLEKHLGRRKG